MKCRKYEESLVDHPPNQSTSFDIFPIWIPVITAEVRELQLHPLWIKHENYVFMLLPYRKVVSLVMIYVLVTLWFCQQ
jgi:hypothetical protein